jgi:tol-pal system protein YbgF
MRGTLALLCLALFASVSGSAHAGLFDDDQARQRIEQLRGDVTTLTQRVETITSNQLDFANQIEAIRANIATLRGQLEVITHDLNAAQKRQQDFYVDLDNRLRKLEQPVATANNGAAPPTDPAAETRDYEAALGLLKASKFNEAGTAFLAFLTAWPQSTLQASATYWGAYAHAQAKDHAKAAEMFAKFAATWPDDERAPNALEAQATSLDALKDSKAALAVRQKLVDKYPASEAGKRAKWHLKSSAGKKK